MMFGSDVGFLGMADLTIKNLVPISQKSKMATGSHV